MAIARQSDFGAGIYRGREAPENAAYDLLNLLLDDEGQPYRRGGSVYKSNVNAGAALTGLLDAYLVGGARTVFWRAGHLYVLAADDVTPVDVSATPPVYGRPTVHRGVMYWMVPIVATPPSHNVMAYAGSRKTASYSTGTAAISAGSRTVTGTGTAWLANVDPGMFIRVGVGVNNAYGWVATVDSDTQITLVEATVNGPGAATSYVASPVIMSQAVINPAGTTQTPYMATAADRVLIGWDRRVIFSTDLFEAKANLTGYQTNYHELPGSSLVVGIEGTGDGALVFTTAGIWSIDNLSFDAVDDAGNIQHVVRRVNELVLWAESGLAQWSGAVLVPAVDNVYLLPPGAAPVPIGAALGRYYRDYAQASRQPGLATVHRGHYFLPILNGATVVDGLVCRLDREFAWTRMAGHAAGSGYAQRIGSSTRSPRLLGISGERVTDLTDIGTPSASNASEADGTTHAVDLVSRDIQTPGGRTGSTLNKARAIYEGTAAGAAALTMESAVGVEGSAFTARAAVDGTAAGVNDGMTPKA